MTNWSPGKFTPDVPSRTSRRVGRPAGVDGDETRLRILEAARSCFAVHGYAATTNRMIADRAGLTAAAVYHHFGKKPDLMVAVHRATEEIYRHKLEAAVAEPEPFIDKVLALMEVIHETTRDDPEEVIFYAVARDEARRHPELRAIEEDRTFTRLFADLVEAGVASGEVAPADAVHVRGAIATMATGLAMLARELSVDAHRVATDGAKRLLAGSLLSSPVVR